MSTINTKFLYRFRISSEVFERILDDFEWVVKETAISDGYTDLKDDVHTIYYDPSREILITNYLTLQYYGVLDAGEHYMQRLIAIKSEQIEDTNYYVAPYAREAVAYINKLLHSVGYTDDDIDECLNSHTHENVTPIHEFLPHYYDEDKIYKFTNCVYYDINNAHMSALCLIFPKAARKFHALRRRINKLKQNGQTKNARWLKDIVNFYCGWLGQCIRDKANKVIGYNKYRATYMWIVQYTRDTLQNAIDTVNGEILYANTDGVIIHNPTNKLKTSDDLGEFKDEITGDTIYVYRHVDRETTNYMIYQYVNAKNEIELKGSLPKQLRSNVDLANGIVVTYKQIENNHIKHYENIQTITKEIEENGN